LPQCTKCFVFGHAEPECSSKHYVCEVCARDHHATQHREMSECCRDAPADQDCPHLRCANCGGPHVATDTECVFFQHRSDDSWILS
ncbi:hypothetical protein C8Q76DRAFT_595714, partial [Earliella scabrosa]